MLKTKRSTLATRLQYMKAIADLEMDLAEACGLTFDLQMNRRPDDLELQQMQERWAATLVRSRAACRQPRPRTLVDRIAAMGGAR